MSKYRKFIEECHPELLQEAEAYVNGVNDKEKAKRQLKKQQELEETRNRVPWYEFPFSYKQQFADGQYDVTETSNISFRDAFAMFTDHFWHEKFRPIPNLAEAPRSHWPFEFMLGQLKTDEKTFMDRFMDFLYNPESIGYIKAAAPDGADTEDMCWDGSIYAYKATGIYKKRPMMACIKDWIKAMHFEW
jgi:hypothetical protein